ncbi:hypothetical protein C0Q70_02784 [Pomacea canaliculata]|uniref:non-specific serine/threonine protein kinase n=1 Tax=Pomacea canaliculata TaxID=400727 RepID=A0A2T7PQX1_POMCA|nr:hypothetical protein C0Q70_02784 [Pomacea canaliculata]
MAAAEKAKADKERMEKVEAEKENRNENEKKGEKEHVKEYDDGRAEKAKDEQTGEKIDQPRDNPVKVETTTATVATEEKDKERKRKRDNAGEKEAAGRKAKVKVVRRSRAERQVANDTVVMERYDLGRTMGDGNFAIVRWARHRATGQEFAMKVIDKPKLKGKEHMVENEIDIMKDCNHPNIVKLYEEYETADKIYLVMELVKGGDLFDAITQSVKFGEVDSAHMVHRNKDTSITLKLADFGLAMEVKELIFTVCGTPTYVAPEILTESGYGLEVDMWAVGVITYILLCGFPPFRSPDRNQTELFEYIKAGAYEFLSPYWDNVSESAKDLIRRLLVVDKSKRYTAVDVLSHPWIVCGGNTNHPLPGISSVSNYCKEVRRDLEEQAKHNYESYQRLKEKKRRDE